MLGFATALAIAASCCGALQFADLSIDLVTVSVPNSLSIESHPIRASSQLLSGSLGPLGASDYQPIRVEIDYSFQSYSIPGDHMLARLLFVPHCFSCSAPPSPSRSDGLAKGAQGGAKAGVRRIHPGARAGIGGDQAP